jgi:hypothetical protein
VSGVAETIEFDGRDDDEQRLIEEMLRYVPEKLRAELRRQLTDARGVVVFKKGPAELQALSKQLLELRSRRAEEAIEAEERQRPRVDREPVLVALVSQVPDGLPVFPRDDRAVIVRDPAADPMDNILILEEDISPEVLVGAVQALLGVRERDGPVPSDRKVLGAGGTWDDIRIDESYAPPQQARIRQWVNQLRTETSSRNVAGIGELQRTVILTPTLQ